MAQFHLPEKRRGKLFLRNPSYAANRESLLKSAEEAHA
jgi:hypothetical protein